MKSDISEIKSSPNVFIFADKTSNIYKAAPRQYNKLLKDNLAKSYKKWTDRLEQAINMEAKNIAKKIQLSDRIECLAKTPAFITLKDHNFQSSLLCRLINASKSKLGKVSKSILENINQHLVKLMHVNQWKNSASVIEWFRNIEDKRNCAFIKFVIREFYPSITETILDNALLFAKQHHDISNDNTRLIKHCRKSLPFSNNEARKKKQTESCFDVTVGSFEGAEVCELVGIYILCSLAKLISKEDCGLYRDDGLLILRNVNGQQIDRMRKNIIKTFKEIGFAIDVEANLKIVDFLNTTFSLNNGTYRLYKKPNGLLLYIKNIQTIHHKLSTNCQK